MTGTILGVPYILWQCYHVNDGSGKVCTIILADEWTKGGSD